MTVFDPNSERAARVEAALRASRAESFGPGFSDRVMARLALAPASLGKSMQHYFMWMTPALIAAILLLAFLNIRSAGQASVGAALGLPQVTIATAYALGADSLGAP